MIKLQRFVFSPFNENTFVLWDEDSRESAIVDPGCLEKHEEDELSKFIENKKLDVKYLISTHCHIDHIFGNAYIKEKFECEYIAPEEDTFLIGRMGEQAKMFGIEVKQSPQPDKYINVKEKLVLGKSEGDYIFTPGHTPGECCIYFENEKFCITGDVLFKEGIGRTDLWGGDYDTLMESIKTKLLTLPEDTVIYPGHGEDSTIGDEIRLNSFLK